MTSQKIFIGTAGWSIPKSERAHFADGDSLLARYSSRFNAVEINSSFYRRHKAVTYERWNQEVPDDFRFSVKLSRSLTHELKLLATRADFIDAINPILHLKEKLGCILVQLPPSLSFQAQRADTFFASLRERYLGMVVFEPRHKSWLHSEALQILNSHEVFLVEADPDLLGLNSINIYRNYYRLHGSPRIYESPYSDSSLKTYATKLNNAVSSKIWCIFDNTKYGHATSDALKLKSMIEP